MLEIEGGIRGVETFCLWIVMQPHGPIASEYVKWFLLLSELLYLKHQQFGMWCKLMEPMASQFVYRFQLVNFDQTMFGIRKEKSSFALS